MSFGVAAAALAFGGTFLLIALALGVSYYILQNQRLRLPYLEEQPFELNGVYVLSNLLQELSLAYRDGSSLVECAAAR